MTVRSAAAEAPARAALAGNPSDGYGGRTLAVTLDEWRARVEVAPVGIAPPTAHAGAGTAPGFDVDAAIAAGGGTALAAAAVRRLRRAGVIGDSPFELRWTTDIPRQVGLAGSSAIVIATMRALTAAHEVETDPHDLALLALEAETVELGIAAGPQDRVVQAHGGLVYMDFDPTHGPIGRAERLAVDRLPPLFVAWRTDGGESSHELHSNLRTRSSNDDDRDHVTSTMARLADHATAAADALRAGDHDALARAMNASFDTRCELGAADPHSLQMVRAARQCGCPANQAGSGGAVVGVLTGGLSEAELRRKFAPLGSEVRVMLAHRQG